MTWTISGDSSDVVIGVSTHGNTVIRGEGNHTPYIFEDWVSSEYPVIAEALRRFQIVKADWRIVSTDAVQNEIFDNAALLKRIKASSGKCIGAISCSDRIGDSKPALSFNIALQPQTFQQVLDLFLKLVVADCEIQYTISVGFTTFGSLSAGGDTLSLDEFKSGHPYFSDEIYVSVRNVHKKEA